MVRRYIQTPCLGHLTSIVLLKLLWFAVLASSVTEEDEAKSKYSQHPENTPSRFFRFQILSSRDHLHVYIDSKEVLNMKTINNFATDFMNTTNGLHMVAVNPKSGSIVMKRHFMTELFGEDVGLASLMNSLKNGEIVLFAAKYDAMLNLSENIRKLFRIFGAFRTPLSTYRCYFVWTFIPGGKTWAESVVVDDPTKHGEYWASPIYVDVIIPKDVEGYCWNWPKNAQNIKRTEFCYSYGGYGDLCSCRLPLNLDFITPKLNGNTIRNVPILIIASNRPHSLLKCLLTILRQPGGHRDNIVVAIDGVHPEVNKLLELLEIRYFIQPTEERKLTSGGRISNHYRYSLNLTLDFFPTSEFMIVLEEDLLVAPDFVSFFSQTAKILASDNSLYCVNAWNDLSAMHTGGDPHKVMRQETHPSCGWMVKRELIQEMLKIWPSPTLDMDWDMWFRGHEAKSTRECIVPEISRSFHLGESGAHVKGQFTFSHITGHLTTANQNIHLKNLERVKEANYEEDLYELLSSDKIIILNTSLHPCDKNFIPSNFTDKTVVVFFWMESIFNNDGWFKLSSCLGIFNMDARNHHRGLLQFYFYSTRVFAIGYPFSDYSFFKPNFVTPVSEVKSDWDIKNLYPLSMMNRRRFRVPHMERHLPFQLSFGTVNAKHIFTNH